MERNVAALVRTSAVLVKLSERLDVIEGRLNIGAAVDADDDAPVTEEHPASQLGRLALRADGAVMLEVTSDLSEDDLKEREVARFVTLTQAEALDAVDRADVGFSDAASRAAWQVARARKGYPEPTGASS
jgi:hypothetical protein